MAKRGATRELNHDNWDDDDDDEEEDEAGTWKPASSEAIKGRVIKQARRKLTGNHQDGEGKPNAFAGFSGLCSSSTPKPASGLFNLNFTKAPEVQKTNGNSSNTEEDSDYLASLKSLNEAVSAWIADHVQKNPLCVLTPVFRDYEKHLKDLEAKRDSKKSTESSKSTTEGEKSTFRFGVKQPEPSLNLFGNNAPATTSASPFTFKAADFSTKTSTSTTSLFSFGAASTSTSAPSFSFGSTTSTTTTMPSFSFTSSAKPLGGTAPVTSTPTTSSFSFGFAAGKKPVESKEEEADQDQEGGGEDDEDSPPKVEVKPVQEEDAFYSVKCKLFYKKDSSYAEKGVGTLHLKKTKEDKTQLVIRADTSLGNILLNILLNPQLTTQRVGKNNVMLVCVPNPPIDSKTPPVPTPMLLRVKTDVEADELLAKLNDNKK